MFLEEEYQKKILDLDFLITRLHFPCPRSSRSVWVGCVVWSNDWIIVIELLHAKMYRDINTQLFRRNLSNL